MPPTPTTPDALRARATQLRSVASTLDRCEAIDLHRRAGDDTWIGPTPRRCHDDLITIGHLVLLAGRDLRAAAHDLDRRAAALDVAGA